MHLKTNSVMYLIHCRCECIAVKYRQFSKMGQQKVCNLIVNLELNGKTYKENRTRVGRSHATVKDIIKKFKYDD